MWPFRDSRLAERDFSRVVVRLPHPLGDQVLATAAVQALRARYPGAHLALHGREAARQLYAGSDFFDEFLVAGKRDPVGPQARALAERGFELCVLLSGSFRSALPAFLARIPHRVGYRRSLRRTLLTAHWSRPDSKRDPLPTRDYYLHLVGKLGATEAGPIRLAVTAEDEAQWGAWAERHGVAGEEDIVAFAVGSAFGPSKVWPAANFAAVADHVTGARGACALIVCGPGEEAAGRAVAEAACGRVIDSGSDPIPVGGLKALLARARALVTNDTGPRHIAAALGTPGVCVLGPMPPEYSDTNLRGQILLAEPVPCAPCHKAVCTVAGHPCMNRVAPARVIEALERVWEPR